MEVKEKEKMFKSLLALTLLASPALGETLLSGAIYFDSQNTMLEVQNFIKASDTDSLARLFKGNHISDKVTGDRSVILLFSGPEGVEFRFADNPTTYWTYAKYVTVNAPRVEASPPPTPSLSPGPNSTLPADFPSSLTSSSIHVPVAMPSPTPAATPTPTPPPPIPTPTPKVRVTTVQEKEAEAEAEATSPPRRRHYRAKESPKDEEDNVPEWAKVWHTVNGRRKWYDKRNYHEVRKALPVNAPPIAAAPVAPSQANVPMATAMPSPVPAPAVVPRAVPARPPGQ